MPAKTRVHHMINKLVYNGLAATQLRVFHVGAAHGIVGYIPRAAPLIKN